MAIGLLAHRLTGKLIPDLDLVPIGVGEEDVRLPGTELTAVLDPSPGALDGRGSPINVAGVGEAEPEVLDPAGETNAVGALFEHEYIARPRRLGLEKMGLSIDGQHSEDIVVELERSVQIAHG